MRIDSVRQTSEILQVQAVVEGKKIEYTRHRDGPWEVYDFPRSFKGGPRFVGHMSPEQGEKLMSVLRRDGWLGGYRYMDRGAERVPVKRGPTSAHHGIFGVTKPKRRS